MNHTRYCKCHFSEAGSEHWALLDRRAFAGKGAKAHYSPDVPFAPLHLKLELYFDWEAERVWGVTVYDLLAQGAEAREIRFDAVNLEDVRVTVDGRPAACENTGSGIIVPLRRAPRPGARLRVALRHAVTRPRAGIYFTKPDAFYPQRFKTVWTQGQDEDSRYYFPCFDQPNFKQTTEVILHLPPGMFGLSNGKLLTHKATPEEELYHYKMELPYSTYLLSIVAGDFATHVERWRNVEVRWHVERGREKEGRNAFRDTARMLAFFSEYTGYPYPYAHYTQIAAPDFIFGGMENFTVTTQTDLTLHDDRAHMDMDSDGLVAHEAAHTWFGDVVTAKSWAHAWLHESFATYFDALYTRHAKGEDEFRYQMLEDAETYFGEDGKYRRPIVTHVYKEPIDLFDAHLYPGGAVRLNYLRCLAGETAFRAALRLFLRRYEYKLAETVDFLRCLEEVTARNYDEWAGQWLYRGGYPMLDISYQWDEKSHLASVTVKQTQEAEKKEDSLLFNLPLKMGFYYGRSSELFPVVIREKEERFCFRTRSKPLFIRLDPGYECPCKTVKLDLPRPMLRAQLERDKDPVGRVEAAAALSVKSSAEDVALLRRRLRRDAFWGVAARIAAALGKIGGDAARDALIGGLRHPHPKVRHAVVKALGGFSEDLRAIKALRKAAAGDASYRVEAAAFWALGRIKDAASRELLEGSLARPTHNGMARSAIYEALGRLEDEKAWPTLIEGARYGAPKLSRAAAMSAIARLAIRHPHRVKEAVDLLTVCAREARGSPAAVFRGKLGAIQALQALDDLRAIPALRELAENEADGRLQRRAEDAIAALREAAKKPKEIKEIRSELDDVAKENKSLRDRMEILEKKETGGKRAPAAIRGKGRKK